MVENEDYFLKSKFSDVYNFRFVLNLNCFRNFDEFICKCMFFYILMMLFDVLLFVIKIVNYYGYNKLYSRYFIWFYLFL